MFKPQRLRIVRSPFLVTASLRVYAQVRPYEGASFFEAVLVVVLRKQMRLYKFFRLDMQCLKMVPSCLVTSRNRTVSSPTFSTFALRLPDPFTVAP